VKAILPDSFSLVKMHSLEMEARCIIS